MRRYTTAYSSLVSRLDEIETLRKAAYAQEKNDPIKNAMIVSATCRGAIVLLSSHVEAFVKEIGEVALDSLTVNAVARTQIAAQFFYHISKRHLDEIKDTGEPAKIAEKVFNLIASEGPYWSRVGPFPQPVPTDQFNRGFANPSFEKIKSYFNRFGYSEFETDLKRLLKANFAPVVNMVDHLVDTRNKIAHGDPQATKTPAEVRDMAMLMKSFCQSTDRVFASWWRNNFCSIRS